MGKSSLIIVLGISALISTMILKLNSNTSESLKATNEMFCKTQSRLISNSGVEIFLEKLKADISLLGRTINNNRLFNGKYDIQISGVDSAVTIKSTADFMGYKHTSIVNARADKLGIIAPNSGFRVATNNISNVRINGNITISGHNHLIGSTVPIPGSQSIPGIGVNNNSLVSTIISNINGSANIIGLGNKTSVSAVSDSINWFNYANAVVSNPDIIINSSSDLNNAPNLGTSASPKVTFINGDIRLNSNKSGVGILVINGNLEINGNFNFTGLVLAYKNSKIITKINGNGKVWGAIVVASSDVDLNISNGNFGVYYSSQALALVSGALQTRRFQIVKWWE